MVLEHELEDGLKKNGGRVRGVSSGEECEVEVGVVDWASLDDFLGRGVWNGESRRGVGGLRVKRERRGFSLGGMGMMSLALDLQIHFHARSDLIPTPGLEGIRTHGQLEAVQVHLVVQSKHSSSSFDPNIAEFIDIFLKRTIEYSPEHIGVMSIMHSG